MVPNGWEVKKLEDLCASDAPITYGVLKPGEYCSNGIPLLQIKDLSNGQVSSQDLHLISKELDEEYKRSRILKNDILISLVGTIGRVAKFELSTPANIHRNLGRVRTDYHEFIFHFLNSDVALKLMGDSSSGSSQSALNLSTLRAMKVPFPPFKEQQKIAQILSTWDQAISTTEKMLENSQQQKRALMQQLLMGKKRLFNENGERFSNDWNKLEIGEILAESRIPSENNDPSKRLTVRLNLKGIQPRACRGTEAVDSTAHFIRSAGQFIYGKQNIHKGAFGIIPYNLNGYETSQDLPAFDFTKKCDPSWFLHYMSQESFYTSLEDKMSGTGSKRLNPKTLFKMKIACPNREEQQKIAAFLSVADQETLVIQKKLDCLKQEKKALMQQLLTGKKRVKVAA
ncbi:MULTISPECIES: restriction endonuclease subunit S [unclassified Acinetobacter]|uniref:restriction endonuclease subunit S n=1 Tax=unclassified Acinetobacter TaxID=196816 RepID=UPI0015D0D121|nr:MULTISPECIES: restriction endonuclease subunit S [unclassified Acinetobacter]